MDFEEEIEFGCADVVGGGGEEAHCPFVNRLVVVHKVDCFFNFFDNVSGRILCKLTVAGGITQLSLGLMDVVLFALDDYS